MSNPLIKDLNRRLGKKPRPDSLKDVELSLAASPQQAHELAVGRSIAAARAIDTAIEALDDVSAYATKVDAVKAKQMANSAMKSLESAEAIAQKLKAALPKPTSLSLSSKDAADWERAVLACKKAAGTARELVSQIKAIRQAMPTGGAGSDVSDWEQTALKLSQWLAAGQKDLAELAQDAADDV